MKVPDSIDRLATAKRILVLGSSGSGKTTFSIKLARALQLPTIHLDSHFWLPGWIATPRQEWRQKVTALCTQPSWVMDGTYESSLDLRIPVSDCILLIERSRLGCLYRVCKRKWTIDDQNRPDAPSGQLLDREFLRYVWQYPKITHPIVMNSIQIYGPEKPVFHLRGAELSPLLMRLCNSAKK
ncbi:MAG: hypothetical protein KDB03_12840 [Planctomycetales bacterium]|nr:hypothetical protein [Planctomycetales bacterium]